MAIPPRTIVYFHYRREGDTLTPTTGGLRDAKQAEFDHPVGHGWLDELADGELRLNLAVQGFEFRPMGVAMEHVGANRETWETQAREVLAQLLPECELLEAETEVEPDEP